MGSAVGELVGRRRRRRSPRLRQPLLGEVGGVVKVRALQSRRQRGRLKGEGKEGDLSRGYGKLAINDRFSSFWWNGHGA